MNAKTYSRLAALIFAIVAVLQLARAMSGWPVTVGTTFSIPVWASCTIVRPGLLTNSPATGRYRVLTASKDWRFGAVSRADVADFLVRQVDDRALIGATPLLIG